VELRNDLVKPAAEILFRIAQQTLELCNRAAYFNQGVGTVVGGTQFRM
jgi:hypothetical protein